MIDVKIVQKLFARTARTHSRVWQAHLGFAQRSGGAALHLAI